MYSSKIKHNLIVSLADVIFYPKYFENFVFIRDEIDVIDLLENTNRFEALLLY